jgi:antitoxin component YwqK of YwqJK toxin-antitoxin module
MLRFIKFFILFVLVTSFTDPYSIKRISDMNFRYEFYTSTKEIKPKSARVYFWFKGGTIHSATSGVSGQLLNGSFKKFYHSNQLAEEGKYKNGLKVGLWKSWFENGNLKTIQYWKSGIQSGFCEIFDVSGTVLEKGKYKKGQKDGKWLFFNSKDTIVYKKGIVFVPKPKLSKEEKESLKEKKKLEKELKAAAQEKEKLAKEQEKKKKEINKEQNLKSKSNATLPKSNLQPAKKDNFFKRLLGNKKVK